jgi:hypothetical protein
MSEQVNKEDLVSRWVINEFCSPDPSDPRLMLAQILAKPEYGQLVSVKEPFTFGKNPLIVVPVAVSEKGRSTLAAVRATPEYRAIWVAWNGYTEPPKVDACENWSSEIRENVSAWYWSRLVTSRVTSFENADKDIQARIQYLEETPIVEIAKNLPQEYWDELIEELEVGIERAQRGRDWYRVIQHKAEDQLRELTSHPGVHVPSEGEVRSYLFNIISRLPGENSSS